MTLRSGSAALRLLLAATAAVAACGSPPQQLNHFVGNSTCPTQGSAGPYSIPATNSDPPVGQLIDEMPHTHVDAPVNGKGGTFITYNHDPPTSGCHWSTTDPGNPAPAQAGVYNRELFPEQFVHNLEHGYVVVLYNCRGQNPAPNDPSDPKFCQSDFDALHSWFKSLPADAANAAAVASGQCQGVTTPLTYAKVLVIPWHTMPVKFAVVSWDYYDNLGGSPVNLDELKKFYDNHTGEAPEGACTQ